MRKRGVGDNLPFFLGLDDTGLTAVTGETVSIARKIGTKLEQGVYRAALRFLAFLFLLAFRLCFSCVTRFKHFGS